MKVLFKIQQALFIVLLLSLAACKDDLVPKPIKKGEAPDPVKTYSYTPIPGGAVITYDLPGGADLLYVKATYTLNTGVVRESKSAIYKNTLQVDGFADEGEYEVKLTSVATGEVASAPVAIRIKTLRPAHKVVMDNIKSKGLLYAAFGGLNVDYINSTGISLVFHVLMKNANGKWAEIQTVYSQATQGRVRTRGLEALEHEYGVVITDRWNNRTDTVTRVLTPFQETLLNKALFKKVTLPGDTYEIHTAQGRARDMPVLWDGLHAQNGSIFQTKPSTLIPQWFTFDMGVTARLSRFILYPDVPPSDLNVFATGQPSEFELWGSNNPDPDGSFGSWTKVGEFKSIKPSGLPLGRVNSDDISQARNGEEFEIEGNLGSFRYWRFKTTATWGNVTYIQLAELTFYGAN